MSTYPTHQVIERDGVEVPRTIYAAGLYAVSECDLGLRGVEYRVTHTPTGIVLVRPWRAGLACDLADALDAALGTAGNGVKWGDAETLKARLSCSTKVAREIARILAADNPHGEPPPNPCPTCGHVKEKP